MRTYPRRLLLSLLTFFLLPILGVGTEVRAGFILPSENNHSSRSESSWLNNGSPQNFEKKQEENNGSPRDKINHLTGNPTFRSTANTSELAFLKDKELGASIGSFSRQLTKRNLLCTDSTSSRSTDGKPLPNNNLPLPRNQNPPGNDSPLPPSHTGNGMGGNPSGGNHLSTLFAAPILRLEMAGAQLVIFLFATSDNFNSNLIAFRLFRPPRAVVDLF